MDMQTNMRRVEGTDGDDVLTLDQTSERDADGRYTMVGISAGDGDDVLNVRAAEGFAQTHTYAGRGDDTINMSFAPMDSFAVGHHVRGGLQSGGSPGRDTFNFQDIDNVRATVVGRIEDFDPSRDRIQIEGRTLDLADLPSNVRIVEYNGVHNEPDADPQQWLLIDTGGGHIFYALGGARVDENGNGPLPNPEQETHFLGVRSTPDFDAMPSVAYVDPVDYVPEGFLPEAGGVLIDDTDIVGADRAETIQGTASGDVIAAGLNDDRVSAGAGNDTVWGGSGHDTVRGGGGDDRLNGNPGDDRLFGGAGDDTIRGQEGADTIEGDDGDDRIGAGPGDDLVLGGAGNDMIWAGGGDNTVRGDGGHDTIWSWTGDDVLSGGAGNDRLTSRAGDDVLSGGQGADTLLAGAGDDTVTGGEGRDVIWTGGGADVIRIGDGDLVDMDGLSGPAAERFTRLDVIGDFSVGADRLVFVDDPEATSRADLTAWKVDVGGDAHFMVKIDATNERLLVNVADDVTWGEFFTDQTFAFA